MTAVDKHQKQTPIPTKCKKKRKKNHHWGGFSVAKYQSWQAALRP